MFCHFYGILGHDLRHCPAHFAASKETDNVEYQYGEWLKADSGRTKSPPRRGRENPMRSKPVGSTDTPASENEDEAEVMTMVARVSKYRAGHESWNGNCVVGGSVVEIPEKISVVNADIKSNMDDILLLFSSNGAVHQILNDKANGTSNITNSSLGHVEAKPNKPKTTWTRLNRTDIGPLVSSNNKLKSIME